MRTIEDCLNDHFNITQEEREEAKGQWDETIIAFRDWLTEKLQACNSPDWRLFLRALIKELGDKTT